MAKWARIVDNQVQETLSFDPEGRFPADFVWVPCAEEVQERWTYNAATKKFTPFVLETVEPTPELPPERLEEGFAEVPPPTNLP
jgi:hypothetical protein